MNWQEVKEQLSSFRGKLDGMSDLTIDTLYGSMWGLNNRYTPLEEVLAKDKRMIDYSLNRINKLIGVSNFTFKTRELSRCRIGYGTYGWKYGKEIIELAIEKASIIDTAEGYGYGKVETELGKILKTAGPVEVMTKVRRDHMSPDAIQNAVRRSIAKLNVTPHVMLHFPNNKYPFAVKDLARMRQRGEIKSIGLSNCSIDMIESTQLFLSEYSGDVVNAIQMPFNLVDNRIGKLLIPYCQKRGIVVLAYSPLGQKFNNIKTPILTKMAKKYDCTEAQVALAWILSFDGVLPIPNTNNLEHLKQNFETNDLILAKADVQMLTDYYQYYGKNL